MMAEAIPFGIAESMLLKLGSSAFQHVALISGVKDEVRKLSNTLTAIEAVLTDADEQQEKSLLVQNWIKNLKEVVYDADDILDEFSTKATITEADLLGRVKNQVTQFFSSSNQLAFRYNMAKKIRKIRERLDEIAFEMAKFNFRVRSVNVRVENKEREQTHSYVLASSVTGREEDKEEIVKLLMCSSDQQPVSAIAIVGIGGLGKTTLAKLVYNDERIVRNFGLRMWISVYNQFNLKSIMEKILACGIEFDNFEMEAEKNRVTEKLEMEQLQILVREKLSGKRYLLVVDDVWSENRDIWIQLSELLQGGRWGSKIAVTTRSQKVAFALDAEYTYMLQALPDDASWNLFKQLAFRKGPEDKHPSLVQIGKNIVKKCHGVPLAIRTLGSMLRCKREENEWLSIQENEIWELHDVMNILKLSYDHLPSNLKQCFTYCSLFPKGYVLEIKNLIQLWMAQGYIHQLGMGDQLEDIGLQYSEELQLRSFFQDVKRDDNNNITSCKMHDLMHDLACSVAKPECCIADSDGSNISERVHHVSFRSYLPASWTLPPSLLRVQKVRTLLLPLHYHTGCSIANVAFDQCLRRLRVLDLHNQRIQKLPRGVGNLKHLRYLDLSKNALTTLPNSISKLQNLQTLKLDRCYKLVELPNQITRIVSLRHLEISTCSKLTHMPLGFGKLTSLRTLPRFVIGKSSMSKSGGLNELHELNHLKGELAIMNLERVGNTRECEASNMKDKKYLCSLRLNWSRETNDDMYDDAVVMECLRPHKNLRELHISGYGDVKFPTWMSARITSVLPNLVNISIERCSYCQELPPFGELPFLRVLKLYSLNKLNFICHNSTSSSYFPSLKELVLYDLPLLSDWPRNSIVNQMREMTIEPQKIQQRNSMHEMQGFPSLTKLTIIDCPRLMSLPCPPSLEELVIHNITEELQRSLISVQAISLSSLPE
ncbi:disease resistance protein RGA2-like [Coffea arabica]|uniref:Disease resistance protein RGA2-like n=1 Tax=Coffea arabica TaxID=13443 RepID=A0ABM4WIS9_COFAR